MVGEWDGVVSQASGGTCNASSQRQVPCFQLSVLMFMTQIHAVHNSKILGLRWTYRTEQRDATPLV